MHYYFAYGSNMSEAQMRSRCPDARLLGKGELEGYRLAFTIYSPTRKCGCADVIASPDDSVFGLVYELSGADVAALDRFEGVPQHYRRVQLPVTFDADVIPMAVYEVVEKQEGLRPSSHYLGLIIDAAQEHEFPKPYQEYLATFIPADQEGEG